MNSSTTLSKTVFLFGLFEKTKCEYENCDTMISTQYTNIEYKQNLSSGLVEPDLFLAHEPCIDIFSFNLVRGHLQVLLCLGRI